jgi:hypothetical protein
MLTSQLAQNEQALAILKEKADNIYRMHFLLTELKLKAGLHSV